MSGLGILMVLVLLVAAVVATGVAVLLSVAAATEVLPRHAPREAEGDSGDNPAA